MSLTKQHCSSCGQIGHNKASRDCSSYEPDEDADELVMMSFRVLRSRRDKLKALAKRRNCTLVAVLNAAFDRLEDEEDYDQAREMTQGDQEVTRRRTE